VQSLSQARREAELDAWLKADLFSGEQLVKEYDTTIKIAA
jgi:hypothetical protein